MTAATTARSKRLLAIAVTIGCVVVALIDLRSGGEGGAGPDPARVADLEVPAAEAFTLYVGLGHVRSYAAVAQQYGVATRGILALAKRHRWAERLREIERIVEERQREHNRTVLAEARERHLKSLRILQGKALAGLRDQSVRSVAEASRALEAGIRLERLILGETTSNAQVSVEERLQREVDQLVLQDGDDEDLEPREEGDDDPDA